MGRRKSAVDVSIYVENADNFTNTLIDFHLWGRDVLAAC